MSVPCCPACSATRATRSALNTELVATLRAGADPEFERAAWEVLVAVGRDDLAIAKPGHDGWEGA